MLNFIFYFYFCFAKKLKKIQNEITREKRKYREDSKKKKNFHFIFPHCRLSKDLF